jgi:hypothetical protein
VSSSEYRPGLNGPVEPNAQMRDLANSLRQLYIALVEQGFTEAEAFQIVGVTVAASLGGAKP